MEKERGYVLVLALLIATCILLYIIIQTGTIFIQRRQVDYSFYREKAFALAESGVDAGIAALDQLSLPESFSVSGTIEGMGTFTAQVTSSASQATVTAMGVVSHGSNTITKTIRVRLINLSSLIFDAAAIGLNGVNVSGTGGYIDGDVVVGPGAPAPDEEKVSGDIRELDIPMELPRIPPPSSFSSWGDDDKLTDDDSPINTGGTYRFESMQINSKKTLEITAVGEEVVIYIDGDATINGELKIASGCSVALYVSGKTSIAGQGIVNESQDPSQFVLYGYSKCDFTSENIEFYGAVYAPEISIKVTGGIIQGALVGNTVSVGGGGLVRYDSRVRNITLAGVPKFVFAPGSWEEIKGS